MLAWLAALNRPSALISPATERSRTRIPFISPWTCCDSEIWAVTPGVRVSQTPLVRLGTRLCSGLLPWRTRERFAVHSGDSSRHRDPRRSVSGARRIQWDHRRSRYCSGYANTLLAAPMPVKFVQSDVGRLSEPTLLILPLKITAHSLNPSRSLRCAIHISTSRD